MKKVRMDRNKIIKFIEENVKNESIYYNIQKELVEVVLEIIPLLGRYEEESKKLNFKIALGMDNDMSNLVASSYVMKRYIWNEKDAEEERIIQIENMIKEVAIFCEKSADIFLIQNRNEIECGVFFSRLTTTDVAKESFTEKNFIIFQHLYGNKVLAAAKNDTMCICMDFDKAEVPENIKNTNTYEIDVCRKWEGIFERVKRTVHGTICLIVDTKWNPQNDKNFTSHIETIDMDLRIKGKSSADDIQDFDNKLEMFMAMLNYDGITIIDTEERIRAYNLFCKVDSEGETKISGGARHRAYNSLKRLEEQQRYGYVAIYFQSQEGEVEFYRFSSSKDDKQENEILHFFDANVMYTKDAELNSRYRAIREQHEKIKIICSGEFENVDKRYLNTYYQITQLVDDLRETHNGFYNFYNEPGAANKLLMFIEKNRKQALEILEKYSKIRMDFINIILECMVGNGNGFSWNAQEDLTKIIQNLTEKIWEIYFKNDEFLDTALLWEISSSLYGRWKGILKQLKKSHPNIRKIIDEKEFEQKEYLIMYNALAINFE
ncbi:MAG: hypothetical protein NC313_12770 [Butyrivibrio sp.]|nr:hypothetical protein [Butyrivibrio sp.]